MSGRTVTEAWVRRFHPSPDHAWRLACFAHAGGAASAFHQLSARLGPAAEALCLQYPGRHDRHAEPFLTEVRLMADQAHEALRAWRGPDERPLALFGHSMGAIVAFEVALRMEAEGLPAAHLFVSGRRAPSTHRDERVHLRDDNGLVKEILALGGTEPEVLADASVRKLILPVVRNDYTAIETYRCPSVALLDRTPVTALVGESDPKATLDEVGAWADHTADDFGLRVFGGGHFYLADRAAEVATAVTEALSVGRAAPVEALSAGRAVL
ncbi:thioesterase II family protein [Streptomyces sp. NPDC014894]|uniref:thioesterase II family protein n=1 Tax=Streptomyces sp. NPDC014894 TaxID=3364931 RepID=UPI0036FDF94D